MSQNKKADDICTARLIKVPSHAMHFDVIQGPVEGFWYKFPTTKVGDSVRLRWLHALIGGGGSNSSIHRIESRNSGSSGRQMVRRSMGILGQNRRCDFSRSPCSQYIYSREDRLLICAVKLANPHPRAETARWYGQGDENDGWQWCIPWLANI